VTALQPPSRRLLVAALALAALALPPRAVRAQVTALNQGIGLFAERSGQIRFTGLSGSGQTVTLVDGAIAQYAQPISVGIGWALRPLQANYVYLVAFFTSSAEALRSGTDLIPSAYMEGSVDGGTTWQPFTATLNLPTTQATAGNALQLYRSGWVPLFNWNGTRNVDLHLRVNLTGRSVPIGEYSGTLFVQVLAQ
jgi:hypothetical protein